MTITFKGSTGKATKKATSGSLDDFVIRQPPVTPEQSQQQEEEDQEDLTSPPAPLIQLPMSDFLSKATKCKGKKRPTEDSVYREQSSTEDIEFDPDDPAPVGTSNLPKTQEELYKKLRTQSTHLIFCHEEAYFPGIVTKKEKDKATGAYSITVRSMQKHRLGPAFWYWPAEDRHRDIELAI